ncbi:MAG TPA: hypothetical protein PLZ16_07375 [Gammaproteobacteria bacterium]|mgnify:CR=1 FL=1|nr:hypothetical protein [Gammaproteobacteria bacterium]
MHNSLKGAVARLLSGSPVLRILVVGRLLGPLGILLAVLVVIIGMGILLFLGIATGRAWRGCCWYAGRLRWPRYWLEATACTASF